MLHVIPQHANMYKYTCLNLTTFTMICEPFVNNAASSRLDGDFTTSMSHDLEEKDCWKQKFSIGVESMMRSKRQSILYLRYLASEAPTQKPVTM